jgi:hypothetical protein
MALKLVSIIIWAFQKKHDNCGSDMIYMATKIRKVIMCKLDDKAWQRFLKKVAKPRGEDGCWAWSAYIDPQGYGRFAVSVEGKKPKIDRAHRVAYRQLIGPIPDGLDLDHLCRNRWCCNPYHIEAVPHRVNVARGDAGTIEKMRTHCPQGHEYTEENTFREKDGRRRCKICKTATAYRAVRRHRAKLSPEKRDQYKAKSREYNAKYRADGKVKPPTPEQKTRAAERQRQRRAADPTWLERHRLAEGERRRRKTQERSLARTPAR